MPIPFFEIRIKMEKLIPITGYAKTYAELCNKIAEPGDYYNVLEPKPFTTYYKLDGVEIGDTLMTTDVIGWYKNKAELESNVKPTEGDVYITGDYEPYTRWKAQYVDYVMTWIADGEENKKIIKKYKTQKGLGSSRPVPEEGIFYAVGETAPYKVYGVVSSWEPVGSFISYVYDRLASTDRMTKQPGEIALVKGLYYVWAGSKWEQIDIPEPVENVYKHVFESRGEKYKLREGQYPGTLEFFQPKE